MNKQMIGPVVLSLVVLMAGTASAQQTVAGDKYDEQLARYLESARKQATDSSSRGGSDWINGLMGDLRARHINDLVTVRVVESITATGSADSTLSKASNGSAAVPGLFGLESKLPGLIDPSKLVSAKSDTGFKGAGTTTRAGELTAIVTGRVAEVLPNGDLFIESVREIAINGDRQMVVLTGVARVADITPGNVVLSTSLGQLQIRYFGRGLMKDSLSPGWLIRVLNKIF
jgi:flagellar L-ring protein precursor FlgH